MFETTTECPTVPDDGFQWLKYGQKKMSNRYREPTDCIMRHYFHCRHSECPARRMIDQDMNNPSMATVKHKYMHTCNVHGMAANVIHDANAEASASAC